MGERVVETTCRFDLYFGVLLTTREALKFSFDNAPDLVERIPGDFSRGRAFPALVREVEEISAKMENSSKSGRCRSTDLNARFTADSW